MYVCFIFLKNRYPVLMYMCFIFIASKKFEPSKYISFLIITDTSDSEMDEYDPETGLRVSVPGKIMRTIEYSITIADVSSQIIPYNIHCV